jgi:hypothetical protein
MYMVLRLPEPLFFTNNMSLFWVENGGVFLIFASQISAVFHPPPWFYVDNAAFFIKPVPASALPARSVCASGLMTAICLP